MKNDEAIEEAITWAEKQHLLGNFFKIQKAEVIGMSLTEFDEDEFKRICREDGIAEGQELGRMEKAIEATINLLKMHILSNEQISQATKLPLEKVRELAESITVKV